MTEKDYLDFCYAEYRAELAESEALYSRAGFLLAAQGAIGGALYSILDVNTLRQSFGRWDVMLYLVFLFAGSLCLVLGVGLMILAVMPRRYERLAALSDWQQWRESYRQTLEADAPKDEARNQAALDTATGRHLLERIVEAQSFNYEQNRVRLEYLRRAILWTAIAFAVLALQVISKAVIRIQGV